MKTSTRKASGSNGWRRVGLDLVKADALMREAGFVPGDDPPSDGYGMFDRQNRVRRIHVLYPDGWRTTLVLHLDGTQSLSYAIKVRTAKGGTK